MNATIDKMLELTSQIAEDLLMIKDSEGTIVPDPLKMKIISLAELAATSEEPADTSHAEVVDDVSESETIVDTPEAETTAETPETYATLNTQEADPTIISPETEVSETKACEVASESSTEQPKETVTEMEEFAAPTHELALHLVPEPATEPVPEPEPESVPEPASNPVQEVAAPTSQPTSVDAPRRYFINPAELRQAFSINDAFLFRREIFHGSKADFDSALNQIATFDNIARLEQYVREELRLNPHKSPGKDFIGCISPYFP